uniref:Nudix hydrolase domain-containing protein n=1 Tax=Attheya septentrionalis TaxID=420275 RepID=A0A7S2UI82_9STRA|mmetsp:Transcript_24225/g.43786  ORF Transcript_24225/g.43786 Transcript_24225/m.43786 type:complete len:225 (+) Transcript_24225:129-803(+)
MVRQLVASMSNTPSNPTSSKNSVVPRIDSVTQIASTKWLALQTIDYTDETGTSRKWDVATRTTKSSSDKADAVVIVPLLRKSGSANLETLLVTQYRPPLGRSTIEFPAGLIDKDESPENAALRELREETGYIGEKCKIIPQVSREVCMSPGLTDESVHCVLVEVDLDNPYNVGTPTPDLDDGEYVTVTRVNLKEGLKKVLDDGEGMPIMGLYLFAMGLDIGMSL